MNETDLEAGNAGERQLAAEQVRAALQYGGGRCRGCLSGSLLLVLLLSLALAGCRQQELPVKPTPTAAPAASTGGAPAAGRIVAGGRVVPARARPSVSRAAASWRKLPVKLGEQVAAGQVLAQLDTSLLDQQLAQAEANLAGAQARLNQLDRGPAEQDLAAAKQNVASAQAAYDKLVAGARRGGPCRGEGGAGGRATELCAGARRPECAGLGATQGAGRECQGRAGARRRRRTTRSRANANMAMLPQSAALQQATNNYNAANAAYKAAAGHPTAGGAGRSRGAGAGGAGRAGSPDAGCGPGPGRAGGGRERQGATGAASAVGG